MKYNQTEMRRETQFKDAVLSEAEAKSMQIIADANKARSEALEQAHQACEVADRAVITRRMMLAGEKEYSGLAQNARRDLLRYRAQLVDELFAEVRSKLAAFVKSDDYDDWLISHLAECDPAPVPEGMVCHRDLSGSSVVYLRPADMSHAGAIQKALPGAKVVEDESIQLGGLRVRRGKFLFDKTLDLALEEEKRSFTETSGLTV